MKSVIIAIVGPSGAGKTFASEFLKKEKGIPVIVSYTTRPMRDGETNGVEHFFVDESEMPPKNQMLAYTKFGNYHYWASINQIPENGKCIYVVDEKGLVMLETEFGNRFNVHSVYIKRDVNKLENSIGQDRISRDKDRMVLDESFYNQIIDNDGTLKEFQDKLTLMINNI